METQKRILKAIIIILSFGLIHCSPAEFRTLSAEELQSQNAAQAPAENETEVDPENKITCAYQGEIFRVNEVRSNACSNNSLGSIDLRCENSGQMLEITNSCTTTANATYQWKTSNYGACSAKATFQTSPWSECQNLTCAGGEQRRQVECQPTQGQQTREVYCVNQQGQRVAETNCTTRKPQAQIACQSSCSESAPAKIQACVKGTPCLRSFHTQYLMTEPGTTKTKCGAGIDQNQTSLARLGLKAGEVHGSRCMNPTTRNEVGDYVTWAGAEAAAETNWNRQHPGDCPQGQSAVVHSTYTCMGTCPSGEWVQVNNTIGDSRISPLMGFEESPYINPFFSPFNEREVKGRVFPHFRCKGLE